MTSFDQKSVAFRPAAAGWWKPGAASEARTHEAGEGEGVHGAGRDEIVFGIPSPVEAADIGPQAQHLPAALQAEAQLDPAVGIGEIQRQADRGLEFPLLGEQDPAVAHSQHLAVRFTEVSPLISSLKM